MAKKSAMSKGYRKAQAKKPYLSKRDIIILCALVVAIAIGAILLFTYEDGALKTQDGRIADVQDNWLIVNGSANGRRYFKLGEADEIEGYTRESTALLTDENLFTINYTPKDEAAPIRSIALGTNPATAKRSAEYYQALVKSLNATEVQTAEAGYPYFTYQTSYYQAEDEAEQAPAETEAPAGETEATAEEPAPNRFEQAIHAYMDAPHNSSISITVVANAESEADFLTDEQLLDYVTQAANAIHIAEK